jgi:DNA-directed RNA polymerase subunit RPC12/RpoP
MSFFSRLKRATGSAAKVFIKGLGAGEYVLVGMPVVCPHCGHRQFERDSCLLNTRGATFLGLDWTDQSATVLACTHCGRVQWFLKSPDRLNPAS